MFEIQNQSDTPELISPRFLILTVGMIGFFLPVLLIISAVLLQSCEVVQNSISAYYHTVGRNVFVGSICAISLALFAYKGYGKTDNTAGNIAAFFALGVVFFPTSVGEPLSICIPHVIDNGIIGNIHFISAALLFLTFAFFSIFLFTKTKGVINLSRKRKNIIYKICGYLIVIFIALIACYYLFLRVNYPILTRYKPVFWLESLSLWAFSISWLTKGAVFEKKS